MTRDNILDALAHWINQRPGLEACNYFGSGNYRENLSNYRSESRRITRQLHDARTLLSAVRWRNSIDVPELTEAFRAFSGRLTLHENDTGGCRLEYCTGQYFPTEYRAAACAVLSSALWAHRRECQNKELRHADGSQSANPGDWLRKEFSREFGRNIQERWFS